MIGRRCCALVILTCVFVGRAAADETKSAPPAIVPSKSTAKPLTAEILIAKLAERVDVERAWSGTLENVVDNLSTQTGIPIVIDHVSFKCADPPLEYANDALVRID